MAAPKSARLAFAKDKEEDEFVEAKHFLRIVGSQVEVYWSEDELSGTNCESGWYRGEVQSYDEDEDIIYGFSLKLLSSPPSLTFM